jgi:hypothetical protein
MTHSGDNAMRYLFAVPLTTDDEQTVRVPIGAVVLAVRMQGDTPTLWCIGNPAAEGVAVTILMRHAGATAEPVPDFACAVLGFVQEHVGAPTRLVLAQLNGVHRFVGAETPSLI